ncbi:hypothetical protein EZV73_25080 [Acidaminobacter sp. JC074]|uniref:hypothetical protein n=1 Tax=Acidaminobacter sp. JC074 TaxID=2530199 RepID=UPI001F0E45C3|nr:hypothetical protein [Acidaminobacter sp. JC074]MCH4890878.1 hypothetical protein [Acidaminobacter sp. JC074]
MRKIVLLIGLILLLSLSVSCNNESESVTSNKDESKDDYFILENGDLQINIENQTRVLEINALPDSQIIKDEKERILILTDPTVQYKHGILGDDIEARSVTIIELSDHPEVISKFSVPADWVSESILPIWHDWDEDGQREVLLTLSNDKSGAKLSLYDEEGNVLAESDPIGLGYRWRHALDIAEFGDDGQKLLVEVQTPHIGGIVNFYSWHKDNGVLKKEATLSGYSTHDIGSRDMGMFTLIKDEQNEQVLLILPNQSKTELAALRLVEGKINEEWHIPIGGRLSGNLKLVDINGVKSIRATLDKNQEVLLKLTE